MRRGGGCGWGGGALGRWSLRRLLLDSPPFGRRLAHTVLEQTEGRASRVVAEPQARVHVADELSEEDEGELLECPLCLALVPAPALPRLQYCAHRCCEPCLRQYLHIEICEARVPAACPACHQPMHPQDVKDIVDNQALYDKYEEFSVRRALAADPDTRWCPAPDCSFAVVASGCASCPKLTCLAAGCGASFCYHCKAAWHPTQTCDAARRSRHPPPPTQHQHQPPQPHADLEHGEVKGCPRCSVLIVKVEDGSCNHMVCCVCGAEFCWLCMKEVSDLHYLSPSGCTFWGKKPWSRKKKLVWQLGTLAGAPLGIALVAGVALPALLVGLPLWAGRRAHHRLRHAQPARRRAAIAAAVAAALVVSPVVAGLAVGIGVPILLFYVYGVVPVSLCRAGGCGGGGGAAEEGAASRRTPSPPPPATPPPVPKPAPPSASLHALAGSIASRDTLDHDARSHTRSHSPNSRRLEPSIGEASLSGCGEADGEGDADGDGEGEGEGSAGGDASMHALAGSIGEHALRVEVQAEVSATDAGSTSSSGSSSSSGSAPSSNSARASLLRTLFLYGAPAPAPAPAPAALAGVCPSTTVDLKEGADAPRLERGPPQEPLGPPARDVCVTHPTFHTDIRHSRASYPGFAVRRYKHEPDLGRPGFQLESSLLSIPDIRMNGGKGQGLVRANRSDPGKLRSFSSSSHYVDFSVRPDNKPVAVVRPGSHCVRPGATMDNPGAAGIRPGAVTRSATRSNPSATVNIDLGVRSGSYDLNRRLDPGNSMVRSCSQSSLRSNMRS